MGKRIERNSQHGFNKDDLCLTDLIACKMKQLALWTRVCKPLTVPFPKNMQKIRQLENWLNIWAWKFVISHVEAIWQVDASVISPGIENTAHNVWYLDKQAGRGVVYTLELVDCEVYPTSLGGRVAVHQRDVDKLEIWVCRKVLEFNKEKCPVPCQGRTSPCNSAGWQLAECRFTEENVRDLNTSYEKWRKSKNMGLY